MERNIEKNIRLKVQEAEQYPVRWNKDELWTRMEIHRTTRSRRPVYFSMAASLAVAALAGVYIYQQNSIPDEAIRSGKIKSVHPAIANASSSESNDVPVNAEPDTPANAIAQNSARIRVEEEPYISTAAFQATPRDTTTGAIEEVNIPEAIPKNSQPEVATDNIDKQPKVIIGIIPTQEPPLVTQHEKKKKFRFLKGKTTDGESEGSQLIIARMN